MYLFIYVSTYLYIYLSIYIYISIYLCIYLYFNYIYCLDRTIGGTKICCRTPRLQSSTPGMKNAFVSRFFFV